MFPGSRIRLNSTLWSPMWFPVPKSLGILSDLIILHKISIDFLSDPMRSDYRIEGPGFDKTSRKTKYSIVICFIVARVKLGLSNGMNMSRSLGWPLEKCPCILLLRHHLLSFWLVFRQFWSNQVGLKQK
jgi:hypothetical protein